MASNQSLVIQIAGIVLSISEESAIAPIELGRPYQNFISTSKPDVFLTVHKDGIPKCDLQNARLIFNSQTTWSLYKTESQHIFVLKSPNFGLQPYRVGIFNSNNNSGDIYNRILNSLNPSDSFFSNPIGLPLFELLFVCLLAQGRGLMIHACGIDDHGRGILFAGNSTHGKSTMAKLWKEQATVLNDDRIVIRQREGRFWMYGTPWHSDYTGVAPHGVPLEKIFFLNHAAENTAQQVEGVNAVSKLVARAFPPLWDQEGMGFSLDFCADLVENIPCYELGFVPSGDIMDFIRCLS